MLRKKIEHVVKESNAAGACTAPVAIQVNGKLDLSLASPAVDGGGAGHGIELGLEKVLMRGLTFGLVIKAFSFFQANG